MPFLGEVKIDPKNAERLGKYLIENRKREFPYHIPWRGPRMVQFDVYKVPIEALHFNFSNTRIRAELEGMLHPYHQEPNPQSKKHQEMVEKILLESKYIGEIETHRLIQDLQLRGQLDPVVATADGILIDGNRRLAIFRLLSRDTKYADEFSEMEVCVLPPDATKDELKELEMRTQMSHTFKVPYGKINTALEFRNLHRVLNWTLERIEEITGKQYKKKEIDGMIEVIDLIDEYLKSIPPSGKYEKQYTHTSKGWESFYNLNNILNYWKRRHFPDSELKHIKLFGFEVINYEYSTYSDVRNFGLVLKDKKAAQKLKEESETLRGKKLSAFLMPERVEREIDALKIAKEVLKHSQADPTKSLKLALRRIDSIKISRVKKDDKEFIEILHELKKRITEIERKLA